MRGDAEQLPLHLGRMGRIVDALGALQGLVVLVGEEILPGPEGQGHGPEEPLAAGGHGIEIAGQGLLEAGTVGRPLVGTAQGLAGQHRRIVPGQFQTDLVVFLVVRVLGPCHLGAADGVEATHGFLRRDLQLFLQGQAEEGQRLPCRVVDDLLGDPVVPDVAEAGTGKGLGHLIGHLAGFGRVTGRQATDVDHRDVVGGLGHGRPRPFADHLPEA